MYKQKKVFHVMQQCRVMFCCFLPKKKRHNHKHCSYVVIWSEKMFWLNLIHSVLNGVILQPRAFIIVRSSKDHKIPSTKGPLCFLFHCPFFPLFKHKLFGNSTYSPKLTHFSFTWSVYFCHCTNAYQHSSLKLTNDILTAAACVLNLLGFVSLLFTVASQENDIL